LERVSQGISVFSGVSFVLFFLVLGAYFLKRHRKTQSVNKRIDDHEQISGSDPWL
jgi:hypothetical protein